MRHPGHSVLQVPVPGLESFVRGRTAHYDAGYLSADPAFTHAHVTVLAPFLAHVDDEAATTVAKAVAAVEPFSFRLDRIATFPNGIVHLRPEPDEAFRELTRTLWASFPECPPYDGEYAEVVPHLTLDALGPGVTVSSTRRLLATHDVPATQVADRVDLAWYEPGRCRLLRRWPLGRARHRPR